MNRLREYVIAGLLKDAGLSGHADQKPSIKAEQDFAVITKDVERFLERPEEISILTRELMIQSLKES